MAPRRDVIRIYCPPIGWPVIDRLRTGHTVACKSIESVATVEWWRSSDSDGRQSHTPYHTDYCNCVPVVRRHGPANHRYGLTV